MLAITRYELMTIRQGILALVNKEEGARDKASEGLRVINAILDKNIEVVPVAPVPDAVVGVQASPEHLFEDEDDDWESRRLGADEEYVGVMSELGDDLSEEVHGGC